MRGLLPIIFLFLLVIVVVLIACSPENNRFQEEAVAPVPQLSGAVSPESVSRDDFLAAYENSGYDYSFVPFDLRGGIPSDSFSPWIRPVLPIMLSAENKVIAKSLIGGVGILCDRYVITGSVPFRTAASRMEKELPSDAPPGIHIGAAIVWDTVGSVKGFASRPLEEAKIVYSDYDKGIIILERSSFSRHFMPPPNTCPFVIGKGGSLRKLHKVIVVGYSFGNTAEHFLPWQKGHISTIDRKNDYIFFVGSSALHDWGGPVFALWDGYPHLVAVTNGSFFKNQHASRGVALSIEAIFQIVKNEFGVELKGIEEYHRESVNEK